MVYITMSQNKEATMIMNSYIADELAHKVYHLHQALDQASAIIATLQEENQNLTNAFNSLASMSESGYILDSEAINEPQYSV